MSIQAISEIEEFVKNRDGWIAPISTAEIKKRIADFVANRDKNESYNAPRRYGSQMTFYMRNGIRIERGSK